MTYTEQEYQAYVAEVEAREAAEWAEIEAEQATFGGEVDREIAKGLRARGWSLVDVAVLFSWTLKMDVAPSTIALWELEEVLP